jgi:hypothetical protein
MEDDLHGNLCLSADMMIEFMIDFLGWRMGGGWNWRTAFIGTFASPLT